MKISYLKSDLLSSNKRLRHGFINLNNTYGIKDIAKESGLKEINTVTQVHGNDFVVLSDPLQLKQVHKADAVVSLVRGHGVGVYTADCVPILFYDEKNKIVGAIHAGWKGTLQGITNIVLEHTLKVLTCSKSNIHVAIGPCIEGGCYEIGSDVAKQFQKKYKEWDSYLKFNGSDKYLLDLRKANIEHIKNAGILNIDIIEICTKCDEKLPSYRRDGNRAGKMLSFIGLV